jgi:transposase
MRGRKTSLRVTLTSQERMELERRLRCTTCPAGLVRRSRVILGVSQGLTLIEVARRVQMTEKHVRKWTKRFLSARLAGLQDRPGRGRKPVFSPRGGTARRENRVRTA